MPVIRTATESDCELLAKLADKTFRDAFEEFNTPEDIQLHCQNAYHVDVIRQEVKQADLVTLVVEEQGELIAYAQLGWHKHPDCIQATRPGEIIRFYLEQNWHGSGIAKELMLSCLEQMSLRHTDVIWLGVWEHNPKAIAFYKKINFRAVGAHDFYLGNDLQRDIIMMREL